jgi:hypothetical protein
MADRARRHTHQLGQPGLAETCLGTELLNALWKVRWNVVFHDWIQRVRDHRTRAHSQTKTRRAEDLRRTG